MRASPLPSGLVLVFAMAFAPLPSSAAADGTYETSARTGLDAALAAVEQDLQQTAGRIAAGGDVVAVRSDLEQVVVYRQLRARNVIVRLDGVAVAPRPPAGTAEAVGPVARHSMWNLEQIQALVESDHAFLRRSGNNADNASFVAARLEHYLGIRSVVLRQLAAFAEDEARRGDPYLGTWANHEAIAEVARRAKEAEARRGGQVAPRSPDYLSFAQLVARAQDLNKRTQGIRSEAQHVAAAQALLQPGDGQGTHDLVMIRIRRESYGGYGVLRAGVETTLWHGDTIHIVVNTPDKLAAQLSHWQSMYDHSWCRGFFEIPAVSRASFEVVRHLSGLSAAEAGRLRTAARDRLLEAGFGVTPNGGVGMAANGTRTPFTVPGNVDSIPECATPTR